MCLSQLCTNQVFGLNLTLLYSKLTIHFPPLHLPAYCIIIWTSLELSTLNRERFAQWLAGMNAIIVHFVDMLLTSLCSTLDMDFCSDSRSSHVWLVSRVDSHLRLSHSPQDSQTFVFDYHSIESVSKLWNCDTMANIVYCRVSECWQLWQCQSSTEQIRYIFLFSIAGLHLVKLSPQL